MRSASGCASGSANPPASSAGVKPRGSSSSARGFPRVSAMIVSRTRSSRGPGIARGEQEACIVVSDPVDDQLRQPAERVDGLARHEHDRHWLRQQPARDERERQG